MVKKRYLLVFLILICLIRVYAQTDEVFTAEESIVAPPSPPEEEEEIAEKLDVVFELNDYDSKSLISDIHVNVEIMDKENNKASNTLKYVGNDGIVRLRLYKGRYDISLKVDKVDTNGRDYFIRFDQDVEGDIVRSVYLFSIGSVRGNVNDVKGKAVKGAQIKFECSGNYGEKVNKVSDEFGSFSSYWLPIGSCRVSAMHDYKVGYKDVEIKKGELNDIEITLSRGVISGFNSGTLIFMVVIVFIVTLFGIKYVNKKDKKRAVEKKVEEKKEEPIVEGKKEVNEIGGKELSSRTRDVMKTLKEKEIKVVNFLLGNNYKSTQAKIRYSTGIPKTSLARILLALELKKIIKIEKIGKLKKVELTAWFLGKE